MVTITGFLSDWKLATWNTWRRECWILCLLSQFYYKQTRLDFQTSSPFHSFKHEDHVYGELDFAIIIIIVAALRHGLKRNFKRIRMWRFLLWNDLDTNWWFALTTDHRIFFLNADSDASRYRLYSKNSYTRLKAKILIVIQTLLEYEFMIISFSEIWNCVEF